MKKRGTNEPFRYSLIVYAEKINDHNASAHSARQCKLYFNSMGFLYNKNSFDKERPNKPDKRNRICLCVSDILLTRVINILQQQKKILRLFL